MLSCVPQLRTVIRTLYEGDLDTASLGLGFCVFFVCRFLTGASLFVLRLVLFGFFVYLL